MNGIKVGVAIMCLAALAGCDQLVPYRTASQQRPIWTYNSSSDYGRPGPGAKTDAQARIDNAAQRTRLQQQLTQRTAAQGSSVRQMSDNQCYDLDGAMPPDANEARYRTPQEQWCIQLGLSHETSANNEFPGMLPDGARATSLGNGHWLVQP
jgi:hypothetical protein